MKIIIPMKQVPDTETPEIKYNAEKNTLLRSEMPVVVNVYDEFACEESIRIKEKFGGDVEIIVVTMGPAQAEESIRKCLAMGADRAVLITGDEFAEADTLATASTLAKAISEMEYDIIFCGDVTTDGGTGHVGPQLAELLGIPQITHVIKLEVSDDKKKVKANRLVDGGQEVVECETPVLLTAIKGLNEPRYLSLKGIMQAKQKEIIKIDVSTWGGDANTIGKAGSKTRVINIAPPAPRPKGEIIEGEPQETAAKLVQILREKEKVI